MSAASRRNTRPRTEQAAPAAAQPAEDVAELSPPVGEEQPAGDGAPPVETTSDQAPTEDQQAPATEQPTTDEQPPTDVEGKPATAAPVARTTDGRPVCRVGRDVAPALPACDKPEFIDDFGICGGHYAIRPDLRKEAYRG
ncbi:hypothetical protein [Amycolatopsis sp. NPDC051128]|uniref:hypothetical protein n=1 Tax=Amycolatopsis sp. NPDC051128 TaxID=3155412 RepID=UPI003436C964